MNKAQVSSIVAVLAAVACSDSFQPTVDNVVGSYTARRFTTTDSIGTTDLVKAGAVFYVTLGPRGETDGYVYIPAIGSDPEVVEDIHGTWTMSRGIILIEQTGGTFVERMGFFPERSALFAAKSTPEAARISALLAKF